MPSAEGDGFVPIPNPYIVGNPIEDRRMFFGREDDFEYIRKKVAGGRKGGLIVLCGTRRSGKTSILFQIKRGRLGEGFVPVLIDMQSVTVQEDRDFLVRLAREIIEVIGDPALAEAGRRLEGDEANPYAAFQVLLPAIDAALGDRDLVLMFDEYELFEPHIERGRLSAEVFGLLAGWLESRRGVFIVFTGSDHLETRNHVYWEAFLGKALHRRISFLSRADTLRLIQDPVRDLISHEEGVPEAIFRLTAGQPFYTQVLCQSLVDHLNEARRRTTTGADVDAAVAEIIENPLPQMIFSWSTLSDLEKLALSVIAELGREGDVAATADEIAAYCERERIGLRPDPGGLREGLERLFHGDLLAKAAEGEAYAFKMDLWRLWVARMHSIWQTVNEITSEGREPGEGLRRSGPARRRTRWLALAALLVVAVAAPVLYRVWVPSPRAGDPLPPAVVRADSTLLAVASEPAGASVFWNRERLGTTPLAARPVPAGRGQLCLELAGYRAACDSLRLVADEPANRDFVLEELTGGLVVRSEPPGALVRLDGRDTGRRTPAAFDGLSVNRRHDLQLALAGFGERSLDGVDVLPDSNLVLDVSLARLTHPVTIISEPPGASLTLDGRPVAGTTPRGVGRLEEGDHRVTLSLAGYRPAERTFAVPLADGMLTVDLEPLPPGRLVFQISPYAELWIDGELVNRAAVYETVGDLSPGEHRLRLRHPWGVVDTTVVVEPGQERVIRHTFTGPGGGR